MLVDPSVVSVVQAAADSAGHELPASYRTMTNDVRAGDLLPQHLVAQQGNPEDH